MDKERLGLEFDQGEIIHDEIVLLQDPADLPPGEFYEACPTMTSIRVT